MALARNPESRRCELLQPVRQPAAAKHSWAVLPEALRHTDSCSTEPSCLTQCA